MISRSFRYEIERGMSLATLLIILTGVARAVPVFPNYRDLAVYTTSAPDTINLAKIVAVTQFVNRGKETLRLSARLKPARALGFPGATYRTSLRPGKTAVWTWTFIAPEKFTREVLSGEIVLNGVRERELYISLLGTDYADLHDRNIEKIADRAQVVATYAPRSRDSILTEMTALAARQPKPVLTLAAAGKTEYAILTDALPAPPEGQDATACGLRAMDWNMETCCPHMPGSKRIMSRRSHTWSSTVNALKIS